MTVEKSTRFTIYKEGVENVCRKESLKNLGRFLRSDEERIFKGRLQLYKNAGQIAVEVKGKLAGKITTEDFTGYLEKVKNMSDNSTVQK